MTRAQNIKGIEPQIGPTSGGGIMDADAVNDQVAELTNLLGYDDGPIPGKLTATNFSPSAGIREDKILFDTASGHNHPYSGTASGARLARAAVGDLQIGWHTDPPMLFRSTKSGLIMRYGSWEGIPELAGTGEEVIRIHFSTGTAFDRVTGVRTDQVAGAIFPPGAAPIVLVTPFGNDQITENDVAFAIVPGSVTHEWFDLRVDITTDVEGFSWVAIHDPSQGPV